jgi:hypothetical protein
MNLLNIAQSLEAARRIKNKKPLQIKGINNE